MYPCDLGMYTIQVIFPQKEWYEHLYTALAAFGPFLAVVFTIILFNKNKRNAELARIYDKNSEILNIAIQYPHVEDDSFCLSWDGNYCGKTEKLRYYSYCCLVFNLIEDLHRYAKGDSEKMAEVVEFKEYVMTHKKWWEIEISKSGGYQKEFVCFINNVILSGGSK